MLTGLPGTPQSSQGKLDGVTQVEHKFPLCRAVCILFVSCKLNTAEDAAPERKIQVLSVRPVAVSVDVFKEGVPAGIIRLIIPSGAFHLALADQGPAS